MNAYYKRQLFGPLRVVGQEGELGNVVKAIASVRLRDQ